MAEPTELPPDYPLPPANFTFLVESLLMQTQMQLGFFPMGNSEEENQPNLPIARHSIDLLGMLQEKTRGNLSIEEQRLLENGLTELRFRFVQVVNEQKKQQSPIEQVSAPETPADSGPRIILPDGGKGSKTD